MMSIFVLLIALAVTTPVAAETCVKKFRSLLVDRNDTGPVKITVTQQVKGAPVDANNADQSHRNMEDAAATVNDAACGTEAIDGVTHDTVEASYEIPAYKTAHRDKYWIEPASGWIARSISVMKMSGFESTATQVIEKAPGLELPTPSP